MWQNEILTGAGVLITFLLSGNIYFVKRMVDRADKTSEAQKATALQVNLISANLSAIGTQVQEVKTDIRSFRRLETDIAVLRAQLSPGNRKSSVALDS